MHILSKMYLLIAITFISSKTTYVLNPLTAGAAYIRVFSFY